MATKTTEVKAEVKSEAAEQLLEQPEEEQKQEKIDPWAEQVDLMIPRKPKGEEQQYYVCVNDRRFVIPANGKVQKLPKPIAEVLQEAIEAEYAAQDYADRIQNHGESNPQMNAI